MTLGVRGKLFLVSFLLVAAALAVAEGYLLPRLAREETARMRQTLERLAVAGQEALAAADASVEPGDLAHRLTLETGVRFTFIRADGLVIGDGEVAPRGLPAVENHASRPEVATALAGRLGSATRRSATVGVPFLYVAVPPRGDPPVVVRTALPLQEAERVIASLRRALIAAVGAGLIAAAALSWLASHLVSGPLRDMTAVARNLASRRFGTRVHVGSTDEIGALGSALNALSSDLERTLTDLTRERDLLGAVLHGMADGVLVTDAEARILRANPALGRQIGVHVLPASGSGSKTVLEATRSPELARHLGEVLAWREVRLTEVELPGPPQRFFRLSSAPLADGAGVVTVFHDVTEVRRLERVRRDFVANVSHELRTPVAALQAAGETLLGGALDDPPRAREFTEIVARHAERLGALVSDLLALARLESGELDLDLRSLALRGAVDRVLDGFAARIDHKRLRVRNEVPAGLRLRADERALEQVLVNLLDNAVKYTPEEGRIGIASSIDGALARVVVSDSGPGLEPRHRARVFERFYRVDPGRSRALGGTGLGLSIVKHLVESMGGEVGVESEGVGSSFWFTLPVG